MNEKTFFYQFADIQVDPQGCKVWKEGQPLPLEPKAYEVLIFLLQHRDRLVEKQELLDAIWKETFVMPNVLTRVIANLRKMLGDHPKEARYIETVPTRGYRFIAEVQIVDAIQKSLNRSLSLPLTESATHNHYSSAANTTANWWDSAR